MKSSQIFLTSSRRSELLRALRLAPGPVKVRVLVLLRVLLRLPLLKRRPLPW